MNNERDLERKANISGIWALPFTILAAVLAFPSALDWYKKEFDYDIKGEWSSEKAKEVALTHLNKYEWSKTKEFCSSRSSCKVLHDVLDPKLLGKNQFLFSLSAEDLGQGIENISNGDKNSCRACSPELSIFEFEKKENGWKLISSKIAAMRPGEMGSYDKNNIKLFDIGDKYGILMYHGDDEGGGQGGVNELFISLHLPLTDNFTQVLMAHLSTNNSANGVLELEDWDSEMPKPLKTSSGGFPNIEINSQGTYKKKKLLAKRIYRFNGSRYILDDCEPSSGSFCIDMLEYENSDEFINAQIP